MAFRIKTTHEFLKTSEPPKEQKEPVFILDRNNQTTILEDVLVPQKKELSNPQSGSTTGLAIRNVITAQQDYM